MITECGEPAKTTAAGGIFPRNVGRCVERDDGQVGALARDERADLVVEAERARRAERRELERLGGGEGVGAAFPGARGEDGGAELGEHVEGRSRGRAVGAEPDADPGLAELGERCDSAAEQRVRARTVRDRDVVLGEQGDLLGVDRDAVRGDDVRVEQSEAGEIADPGRPERASGDQAGHRSLAGGQPEELGLALGEVRHHRQAELEGRCVHRRRRGVRRVRRDAAPHPVGQGRLDPGADLVEARERGGRVAPEHLDVDDRAQPEVGAGDRRGAGVARVADGGDSRREALCRAEAGDRVHVVQPDPRLALDVELEPGRELEPVAEARVDRVLEVRVRVHEARHDHRAGMVLALAELVDRADRGDAAVLDRHGASLDRRALDGQHPVCGDDRAHDSPMLATSACRAARLSVSTQSQIVSS